MALKETLQKIQKRNSENKIISVDLIGFSSLEKRMQIYERNLNDLKNSIKEVSYFISQVFDNFQKNFGIIVKEIETLQDSANKIPKVQVVEIEKENNDFLKLFQELSEVKQKLEVLGNKFNDLPKLGVSEPVKIAPPLNIFRRIKNKVTKIATTQDGSLGGSVNGENKEFTLPEIPFNNSERVFADGTRQTKGSDYTISGKTITFTLAPGSVVTVDYDS